MTVSRTMAIMAAALALGPALGDAALAQSGSGQAWVLNPNAPLDLRYDGEGVLDPRTCTTTVRGAVEVTQDRIRLRSNALTAYHARQGGECSDINRLEAQRDVYYVTPREAVRADRAVYDMQADQITFTGGVIITQGDNVASADSVVINLKTNGVQMKGSKARAIFYPNRTGQ